MNVRITVSRYVEEYLDITVKGVESIDEGVQQVQDQLKAAAPRARLLNKQTWMRGDAVGDITIVESRNAD